MSKIIQFILAGLFMWVMITHIYGCATVHQEPDKKVYYKRDMKIRYDGKLYIGTYVLPMADSYKIEYESAGKLDHFTFTTCHRELTPKSKKGFFVNKHKFTIDYKPSVEIEKASACPIQVAGYDIKGRHSFAYMDLVTKDTMLEAEIKCNGQSYKSEGVTICQSKYGLEQAISFDVPVDFMPQASRIKPCKDIKYTIKNDRKIFYKTPKRECIYFIMEKNGDKVHRLSTIGYESILIREL